MNNHFTYFNPFVPNPSFFVNEQENEKRLLDKIENLDKRIKLLEDKINKLEKDKESIDEPTDMYIL